MPNGAPWSSRSPQIVARQRFSRSLARWHESCGVYRLFLHSARFFAFCTIPNNARKRLDLGQAHAPQGLAATAQRLRARRPARLSRWAATACVGSRAWAPGRTRAHTGIDLASRRWRASRGRLRAARMAEACHVGGVDENGSQLLSAKPASKPVHPGGGTARLR